MLVFKEKVDLEFNGIKSNLDSNNFAEEEEEKKSNINEEEKK